MDRQVDVDVDVALRTGADGWRRCITVKEKSPDQVSGSISADERLEMRAFGTLSAYSRRSTVTDRSRCRCASEMR